VRRFCRKASVREHYMHLKSRIQVTATQHTATHCRLQHPPPNCNSPHFTTTLCKTLQHATSSEVSTKQRASFITSDKTAIYPPKKNQTCSHPNQRQHTTGLLLTGLPCFDSFLLPSYPPTPSCVCRARRRRVSKHVLSLFPHNPTTHRAPLMCLSPHPLTLSPMFQGIRRSSNLTGALANMCIFVYIYLFSYLYMYVYTYTHVYVYNAYVYTCVCIHMYMCVFLSEVMRLAFHIADLMYRHTHACV